MYQKRLLVRLIASSLVGYSALANFGCRTDSGQTNVVGKSIEERVKSIENNPNMPPQAKAMAIQQMKAREGRAQQGGGAR